MKSKKQSAVASISFPNHLRIGEYHQAYGGVFAGLMRGAPGKPDYYLFVPTREQSESKSIQFGGYGHDVKEAASDTDGLANTLALCAHKQAHPAAQFARAFSMDGFEDYYLPARHELRLCYINVPDIFDKSAWYWSSTQCAGDRSHAWGQLFGYGRQSSSSKDYEGRCRAVRRLLIIQ